MAEYSVRQDRVTGKWQVKVRQNPGGAAMWFDAGDPCDTQQQAERKLSLFQNGLPTEAIIARDGVEVDRVLAHEIDIITWFMKNTHQSMAYALKFDGYTVKTEQGEDLVPESYWKDHNPS